MKMSGNRSFRRSLRACTPRFTQPLTVRDEAEMRILVCRVDGYPRPEVQWEKSGKPVGKSRRVHMTRCGDKCVLQIKMPQSEDVGLYSCIATNIVGTATTQTKVPVPSSEMKKMNGCNGRSQTLSPIKSPGTRSRSMERSTESLERKTAPPSPMVSRSRSASRNRPKEVPDTPIKSKLAQLTNHIWKKGDNQAERSRQKLEVVNVNKKQFSRSMEDCRKPRKAFLNRVKIPDIFGPQKPQTDTSEEPRKFVSVKTSNGLPPRTSANLPNSLKCETVKDDVDMQCKNRGRIASYLKRFESSSHNEEAVPIKQRAFNEKKSSNSERKNSDRGELENIFFSIGKFIRRRSSESSRKSLERELEENIEPPLFLKCEVARTKVNPTEDTNGIDYELDAHGDPLSVNDNDSDFEKISPEKDSIVERNEHVHSFDSECNLSSENEITLIKCSVEKDCSTKAREQSEDVNGDSNMHFQTIEDTSSVVDSDSPSTLPETVTDFLHSEDYPLKETSIPLIRVHESTEETEIPDVVQTNDNDAVFETPEAPKEEQKTDSLSLRKHCKGKIRYSSPLIEEECGTFPENGDSPRFESLESDPQRVSSPIECPARIVKGPQSVTVLRGESVTLAICFTGNPEPNVIWMKGGRVLSGNSRLTILEGREMSVVTVNEVTADDSGKYVVSVENEGGGDSCFASVAVVGFPEPPGGEPTASEVTDHSLVLSWYGSMYDGGSVVTGYQVEMCTLPDRRWYKVASSVNTSCTVQGLSKGQRYVFRVRAENRYGLSHPSKESKVIRLDDFLQYDTSSDEEPIEEPDVTVTIETGAHFTERFDLKEEVGKGRFGTVYRCVERSCGRPRAAKVIRCLKMKDKEKVRQEIEIMSRLHHPKLMQVLAAFESGRNMIMVMEFISGGELFERVIADDFVLTEQDCILFMRQICNGVAYMHKNNILHLDLKPENILCKTRTSHKIKIIDFGLAREYKKDESLRILFGTPEFVAPEVINYEPVSPASDMWSMGVICYVLLSGLSPFMGDSDTETFANITRGEMDFDDEAFDEISEDAKDFISSLLVKKIKGRMSAEECLKHPWLATATLLQKRPLSTEKLKRFIIRRKWQKSGTAIRALGRMVSLSRSSLGSSCDSYSPLGSPTSSRSRSSLVSRSETAESGDSDVFQDPAR